MFRFPLAPDSELRLLEGRHADVVFAELDRCRLYLRRWLPFVDATKGVGDVRKFIEMGLQQYADNLGFQAGIWYQGAFVGCIGYHSIDWSNKSTSLGYWLGDLHQGRGLMTAACKAMVDHAVLDLKLNRIEISCATANHKSRAIPRRLGFQSEGVRRSAEWLYDHYVDLELFALLAPDWVTMQALSSS